MSTPHKRAVRTAAGATLVAATLTWALALMGAPAVAVAGFGAVCAALVVRRYWRDTHRAP